MTRVLFKISGEALGGQKGVGHDEKAIALIALAIHDVSKQGHKVAIVCGGGNIHRGTTGKGDSKGLKRNWSDIKGMCATVVNSARLCDALASVQGKSDKKPRWYCPLPPSMNEVLETMCKLHNVEIYDSKHGHSHSYSDTDGPSLYFEKGHVVFLGGGSGHPYASTDSACVLRALELNCDLVVMVKNGVDGVYSADPKENPQAKLIPYITCSNILTKKLQVMDATSAALARTENMEIRVIGFPNMMQFENENFGTTICPE